MSLIRIIHLVSSNLLLISKVQYIKYFIDIKDKLCRQCVNPRPLFLYYVKLLFISKAYLRLDLIQS
jgi:hypothetical protein